MASLFGLGGSERQNAPIIYSGLNVSSSTRDLPIAIFGGMRSLSTNALWYNDFQKHDTGKGKAGGGKSGQYTYTAATITALGEGIIDSIVRAWAAGSTTTTSSLSDLNQTFYNGSATQTPPSWITTNYPAEARSYAYTSYLFSSKQDLGSDASIPDNRYECLRTNMYSYVHTSPGWIDPNSHTQYPGYDILLSDFIFDWLTNPQYGMGFSSADLASMTQYATYMRAQGLFYSPLLNKQEKGTQVLDRYAQQSNSWIYWDGTQIQFVPLGDAVVTGNGVTYTPQQDVAYAFGPADFEAPGLKVSRKDPTDCFNRTVLTITDRTYGYVSNPMEYRDDTLVDLFGLRDNQMSQGDDICDPIVGNIVVQLVGKRAANIRNTYTWKTNYRFLRCLPGTIVTLTEPNIGLSGHAVRVMKVEEDDKGILAFTAEEFPSNIGVYTATQAFPTTIPPTFPNANVDPGNVNTPAVVEPDSSYTNGTPFLFIAASGGAQWGGAEVNISFDGTNYSPIGTITQGAIQGILTANLPLATGLDVTHTLSVDCTESLSIPQPVTNADATADRTLSLVVAQPTLVGGVYQIPNNGELLDFGDTTATGTYTADLTYLPRDRYGTAAASHSTRDQFTLLDVSGNSGSTLVYPLPPQYIGETIYLKFLSYNLQKGFNYDLAMATEYSYVPTGLGYGTAAGGVPATPTGLAVTPGVQSAAVSWAANAAADNVLSYNVYRAPGTGASFGSASIVQNIAALGWNDTSLAASTGYTYFLTAINSVGESGHTAGVSVTTNTTVINQFGFGFDRDVSFGTLGAPFLEFTINIPWTIPAAMATSEVKITGSGPSAPTSFPLYVNGVNVGSIDFATSATTATFTKASNTSVTAGYTTQIYLPASLNGMTGRLFGSVVGTR